MCRVNKCNTLELYNSSYLNANMVTLTLDYNSILDNTGTRFRNINIRVVVTKNSIFESRRRMHFNVITC